MGIALLTISSLFEGLGNLQLPSAWRQQTAARRAPLRSTAPSTPLSTARGGLRPLWQGPVRQEPSRHSVHPANSRALRVLRIAEQEERPDCAGRMVISGRMADVCAELDRLAAREALGRH